MARSSQGGTRVVSGTAPEKMALAVENASQDSQAMLLEKMILHGVGVSASSPQQFNPDHITIQEIPHSFPKPGNPEHVLIHQPCDAFNAVDSNSQSGQNRFGSPELGHTQGVSEDPQSIQNNATSIKRAAAPSKRGSVPARSRKMDSSQSPTQSNEGRSYEQYDDNETQNSPPPTESNNHDHRTLLEDDTGAVKFDSFHPSQLSIDGENGDDDASGFVPDLRPLFHRDSDPQSSQDFQPTVLPPETPATIKKPFLQGQYRDVDTASQLFGQTQPTSALKKASPTSSRPSPDVFHHNTISPNPLISSPLKTRNILRTSPSRFESSPRRFDPSSRQTDDRPTSPLKPSRENDGDETVPLSPGYEVRQIRPQGPEPIGVYHPFRNRGSSPMSAMYGNNENEASASDSDMEDDAERKRAAKLKQQKAAKSLKGISFPRSSAKSSSVEVPSTNRAKRDLNRRRSDTDQYAAELPREGIKPIEDDDQETVADSQEARAAHETSKPIEQPLDEELPSTEEAEFPTHAQKSSEELQPDDQEAELPTHIQKSSGEPQPDDQEAGPTPTEPAAPPQPAANPVPDTSNRPDSASGAKEMIPETSPAGTAAQPPRPIGEILGQQSSVISDGMNSLPAISSNETTSNEHARQTAADDHTIMRSSPPIVPASSQGSMRRRSGRQKPSGTPLANVAAASNPSTQSSSLSTLSTTPKRPSSITPNTEITENSEGKRGKGNVSSPAAAKDRRRGRDSGIKTYSLGERAMESRRGTRQFSRQSSVSTDELVRSPSVSVSGDSDISRVAKKRKVSRKSVSKATSKGASKPGSKPASKPTSKPTSFQQSHLRRETSAKSTLFQGMAFAVSILSEQIDETADDIKKRYENEVRLGGGSVLEEGFDELFQFDTLDVARTKNSSRIASSSLTLLLDTGFTALITDGHSRKVKYMQALALGLPCLAPKWLEICIAKDRIVDWTPYLLCAGPSDFLDGAIRSRDLRPYDASTSKLADVIAQRPRFLDASHILLVLKRGKDDKNKLSYIFLAQVLGASLERVFNAEEARSKLLEKETQGTPFDWVYVEDGVDPEESLFGAKTKSAPVGGSKKRKRPSLDDAEKSQPPPKRIRTLKNELVIQSLILGRLIEEDEV